MIGPGVTSNLQSRTMLYEQEAGLGHEKDQQTPSTAYRWTQEALSA